MRYLMILRAAQPASPPPPALMEGIMKLGAEATAAGALLDTGGLLPEAAGGATVELVQGHIGVVDGPFAESKEYVSYTLYDVRSREEAIEWANRFLRLHQETWPEWEGSIVLRKVMGPEDFPA